MIGSRPQTAGNSGLIRFCCCNLLMCGEIQRACLSLSRGLQSGGGRAPILARGCPNTGGLARVPGIAITTRHTPAPRSAGTGRRSASGGRRASRRRRARASAVRLVTRTSSGASVLNSLSLYFPRQSAARLCGWVSWTRGRSSRTWPVYWRSSVRSSPSM